MANRELGIYIHIPFCKSKCLYCDFPSYAGAEGEMESYLEALLQEMELGKNHIYDRKIKSIYIGGGTPTYFKTDYIGKILHKCYELFDIDRGTEITIEANPGTLDRQKLIALREYGINRLSMGLQAWQSRHLKALGRTHDSDKVRTEVNSAKAIGFENISVDLMFGLPGQTMDEWIETLENVCSLDVEHMSTYSLIIEEGTPLHEMVERKEVRPIDEDIERQMYREGIAFLKSNGYEQYEISNFAKKGFQSIHNLIYWRDEDYIGFGCGAHSYTENIRRYNYHKIGDYIAAIEQSGSAIEYREHIDTNIERFEMIMMGLRLTEGVDKGEFLQRFGKPLDFYYRDVILKLKHDGLLAEDYQSIYITPRGMDIHNTVLLAFLDYINK